MKGPVKQEVAFVGIGTIKAAKMLGKTSAADLGGSFVAVAMLKTV